MNLIQLEQKLQTLTESEIHHQKHPQLLSSRYKRIPKTLLDGEEVYLFKFDSIMNERNICMNQESRFTSIPRHIHSVIELNYVYHGNVTQIINGCEITLHQGDICILDMNTVHEILPLSKDDILITIGMRKKFFVDSFLTRLSSQGLVSRFLVNALSENHHQKQHLIFRHQPDIDIHPIVQQLLCEYYDTKICSNEITDSYMIILFSQLLRIYQNQTAAASKEENHNELLLMILKYMESNYKNATLDSVAKIFGFHPNYLTAYIKKHTGKSYKELIITQKMLQAGFYLKNSDFSIETIANEVGYHNLGFFYRKFQDYYHMTPVEYRETVKSKVQ